MLLLMGLLIIYVIYSSVLTVAVVISIITRPTIILIPPVVLELVLVRASRALPIILMVGRVVSLLLLALISLEISRTIVVLLGSRRAACLVLPWCIVVVLASLCGLPLLICIRPRGFVQSLEGSTFCSVVSPFSLIVAAIFQLPGLTL